MKKTLSFILAVVMLLGCVNITAFAVDENGCPDCHGTGKICQSCGGTGDCLNCSGTGKTRCSLCSGTGKEGCFICSGAGTADCDACGGSGTDYMSGEPCEDCGGSGKTKCGACAGTGKVKCHICSGVGEEDCFLCSGTGECGSCIICTTCNGTGKVAPAEEQKEILPFSQYNVVFDETDNMNHYYYEGTNFTITGSSLVDERGVVAGNKWYPLTVKSNDPAVIITRVEAVVSYFGEDYELVGIDKGEKMELDEVENGTTVHINNIDSDSFSFVGGEGTASFSNITVYYVGTPNTCEHSFTGEYLNNGDTHLRKCAYCDAYGAEESHTFVKHKCVCGAMETVQKSELLQFNMNNINDDNTYTYVGNDFTLYNSPAPFGYGMNVGGTSQLTITSNDPSLVINRIEAVVYLAGTHYNTIIPSSGVKLEKGGVANGTTVHVNNIDASAFSFTGLGDNGCKMTDITVFYTNGELIHKYNGEYKDNGTTHSPKCTECDEYGKEEAHDFSGDYKNNGETHSQKCTVCGVYGPDVQHIYENGVCACGAEDPSEFVITEDGTLIKYNGLGGDIILPAGILAINDGVFEGNNTITSVEFPYYDGENVMVLGASAFKDCKNLTNVVLPETITRIGANAFAGCESLSNITISNTVNARFLGNGAFDANYLKTVSFPCYLDEDTMADMMGRYGDFTYKQLDHNYVNHECTVCGAISDHDFTGDCVDNGDGTHSRKCTGCDQYGSPEAHSYTDYVCICGAQDLETVKAAATAELNAAIAAAKCGEAKEVLTQALNDLATAQTVAAVKGIAGNAKNTANQYDNDYSTRLVGYTSALDAELNKPTASESLKARIEKLKEDIANAPTISELDRLFLSNIADIQLEGLKDAAVSEINAAKTDANASIAEAAVTAIGSAQSEDEINTIKSKALANMAKADAELAEAKGAAEKAIDAAIPTDASDAVKAAAETAKKAIDAATTTDAVNTAKENGLTAIADQLAAEELAEAKEAAKAAIDAAVPADASDEVKAVAEEAKKAIDAATTTDAVNTAKDNGLTAIEDQIAEELAEAKGTAKAAILAERGSDNAKNVVKAAEDAIAAIEAATTVDEVNEAKDNGIKAIRDAKNANKRPTPETYYTLTFNTNGGSAISSVSGTYGKVIDLDKYVPTKSGYDFGGWYSDKALTTPVVEIKLTGNKTVYAKWNKVNPNTGAELPFTDVKATNWSYEDIAYVYEKGLMQGTSATTFSPQLSTSRAMIVTILWRLEGSPVVNYAMSFDDVAPDQWYTEAIRWAQANGIVNGYSAEKFGMNDPITREQMATILYRYAGFKGYDVSAKADLAKFADSDKVGSWAVDAIAWANAEGLVNGTSATTLSPKGSATREQVAAILHRFCENIVK